MEIKPVSDIPDQLCADLEFLFTDIDDTITKDGMMPYKTLQNMYQLQKSGIKVVLVTGGPAGWCDYFARMWPVSGVIGENGAFYFSFNHDEKKMLRKFLITEKEIENFKLNLNKLERRVLAEVQECRISVDQIFRLTDLAIDIGRDGEVPSENVLQKLYSIIDEEGVRHKTSSVHINCWCGNYDKLSCLKVFMDDFSSVEEGEKYSNILYVGDAPNDEPIFAGIKNTVAVANIKRYVSKLTNKPTYITSGESADGFNELVEILLDKR